MWTTWIFSLEAIAIVITNTITIVTFIKTPSLRMRKYSLLVNLAVVDLLVGLIAVPLFVCHLQNEALKEISDAFDFLDPFLGLASLLGLAAVAIERAYATYYPFKHLTMGKTPYIIGLAVAWLGAFFMALSLFFLRRSVVKVILVLLGISIPLVMIVGAYFLIWVKLSCLKTAVGQQFHQRNKKLSVTIAIVTAVSVIAWAPFMGISAHLTLCATCFIISTTNTVSVLKVLHYGNSLVNFVVYSLRMPDFRAGIICMFESLRCPEAANFTQNDNIELQNRCPDRRNSFIQTKVTGYDVTSNLFVSTNESI